ncbi:MAG: hypothetical protein KF764_11060 [Labilithrix sp.]|nr:hypothetical protein [Labilithrix sp.]
MTTLVSGTEASKGDASGTVEGVAGSSSPHAATANETKASTRAEASSEVLNIVVSKHYTTRARAARDSRIARGIAKRRPASPERVNVNHFELEHVSVLAYSVAMSTARLRQTAFISLIAVAGAQAVIACGSDTTGAPSQPGGDGGTTSPAPTTPDPLKDAAADVRTDANDVVNADLTADFSKVANPSGVWTYGYSLGDPRGDAGALIVFTTPSELAPNIPYWFDPTHQVLNDPCIYRNETNEVFADGIQPGDVALHPGNAAEYAIARFTAPAAGTYAITVQFKEGDTGDTNGLLLHNGAVLVNEESTSTNKLHDLVRTLAAGDTLDVAVGNKGDFLDDSTPVVFKIRSTSP